MNRKYNLNIAYVGALIYIKGLENFYMLINNASVSPNISWFVFGWIASPKEYPCESKAYLYGSYHSTLELYDALDYYNIDLVVMPYKCPESFSYTMSEIWEYGIPTIVSDRGALESRSIETGCGWVYNPKKMHEIINWLIENPEEYDKMLIKIQEYNVPSIKEMYSQYSNLYNTLLDNTSDEL